MYYPSLQDFIGLARQGNLIPVTRRLLADFETPLCVYQKLRGRGDSFLFESVEGGEHLAEALHILRGGAREDAVADRAPPRQLTEFGVGERRGLAPAHGAEVGGDFIGVEGDGRRQVDHVRPSG